MKEIPRSDWKKFFDAFSRDHQGWIVSAEVLSQELGAQPETAGLPFEGAMAEVQHNDEQIIVLLYGNAPDRHVSHTITSPLHIRVDEGENEKFLQIESVDSATTILKFRKAKSAEQPS